MPRRRRRNRRRRSRSSSARGSTPPRRARPAARPHVSAHGRRVPDALVPVGREWNEGPCGSYGIRSCFRASSTMVFRSSPSALHRLLSQTMRSEPCGESAHGTGFASCSSMVNAWGGGRAPSARRRTARARRSAQNALVLVGPCSPGAFSLRGISDGFRTTKPAVRRASWVKRAFARARSQPRENVQRRRGGRRTRTGADSRRPLWL